eukprot:11957117-Heterocapsa_arctica.AAC.1
MTWTWRRAPNVLGWWPAARAPPHGGWTRPVHQAIPSTPPTPFAFVHEGGPVNLLSSSLGAQLTRGAHGNPGPRP